MGVRSGGPPVIEPSTFLLRAFVALSLVLAAAFVAAVYVAERRTAGRRDRAGRSAAGAALLAAAWMGATILAAASGRLSFDSAPPTMLLLFAAIFALAIWLARSRLGERLALGLPLAVLVGFQGFRIAVELLLHRAYAEGLMPVQMSYSGWNFDIVSGATAIAVAALIAAGRASRRLVAAWNWLGLALLANILTIALLSAPTPLRTFHDEPANVWVTRAPFVWLPAVMVLAALVGHLLLFRRLRAAAVTPAAAP